MEDNTVLKYLDDDGTPVEPEYYIPILPMVLINGALGIGTGFSTNVPCFNPSEIIEICKQIIYALDKEDVVAEDNLERAYALVDKMKMLKIHPWYMGFQGTITEGKEGSYISHGVYHWVDETTVEITELPIGTWTEDYKNFLIGLIANGHAYLKDFENRYTDLKAHFLLKLYPGSKENSRATLKRSLNWHLLRISVLTICICITVRGNPEI